MDPILYFGVYREEMDSKIILRYNKPTKPYCVHHLATDHVQKNQPKVGS